MYTKGALEAQRLEYHKLTVQFAGDKSTEEVDRLFEFIYRLMDEVELLRAERYLPPWSENDEADMVAYENKFGVSRYDFRQKWESGELPDDSYEVNAFRCWVNHWESLRKATDV